MTSTPQELTPTTMDALREELDRVRSELAKYVGHEPTVAEEMRYISEENETLRKTVAFLVYDALDRPSISIKNDDIDYMTGRLDIEDDPNRGDATRITYSLPGPGGRAQRTGVRKSIDHRREAERHASKASHVRSLDQQHPIDPVASDFHLRMAMVHATLARGDENTADQANAGDALTLLRRREHAVRELVSTHIAQGLASREAKRWKAAVDLAKGLDEADANMDDLIDRWLTDEGWDARSAWKTPASAVRSDDPWAASPDITADIPAPVRRVIAGHLAEALLDPKAGDVQQWARGLTFELKRVGLDLAEAIKERITAMTLGADPSEPPF